LNNQVYIEYNTNQRGIIQKENTGHH